MSVVERVSCTLLYRELNNLCDVKIYNEEVLAGVE